MKKNIFLICFLTISSLAYSQVGVNTANPQGMLHVDGAKDNPQTGTPTAAEQANDFTVTQTGNVGIGTTAPHASLEFNTDLSNRKIVMYETGDNDHQFYGFGINGGALRYQTDTPNSDHVFYSAASATASNELMRIKGNGNVGIGTDTPNANAILDITSSNKGVLFPRLTTAQRDAITPIPEGLTIYNLTAHCLQYWNVTTWIGNGCSTTPIAGTIATLNCAGATNTGTLTGGVAASGVTSAIPYTGGNAGTHNGQTVASTGVTGLTATLAAANFANGNGTLTYTITGTPSGAGTASFAINIGGRTCTLIRTVAAPVGAIASLTCASASNNGTLAAGTAASGVTSVIPYTGGNGGTHNGQTVASTGVTGLTATLTAGTFANGNGSVTYTITGTASATGNATFILNIGGRSCVLTRRVAGGATPPSPDLTATCTGWRIPFTNSGSIASGNINGDNITATFSGYSDVQNSITGGGGSGSCNVTVPQQSFWVMQNNTSARMTITFSREVSNVKVSQIGTNPGERYQYILRNNGVAVSPVITISPTGCPGSFNVSGGTVNCTSQGGVIYNIGGAWFNQIEIVSAGAAGSNGSILNFCVGTIR